MFGVVKIIRIIDSYILFQYDDFDYEIFLCNCREFYESHDKWIVYINDSTSVFSITRFH